MKKIVYILFGLYNIIGAQNQINNWHFGNAAISFSPNPTAVTNSSMNSFEGCGSISDAAGNLLFYTDGANVWNKNNVVMPNGTGFWGEASSTQLGIVPVPMNPNKYILFTLPSQADTMGDVSTGPCHGCLSYSVIDMSQDGGNGDVMSIFKNIQLFSRSTEKIIPIRHANGCDVWAVTHEYGSNAYYAYKVTATGVDPTPIISSVGISHNRYQGLGAAGYMKASKDGTKIASAIEAHHAIDVLDFDPATGILSNPITLTDSANAFMPNYSNVGVTYQPYGLEFSPDGSKLYVGTITWPYKIEQFDLSLGSQAAVFASHIAITSSNTNDARTLQLGPDGKIYVINGMSLGVINNPNSLGLACSYVPNSISLAGKSSSFGLPSFLNNFTETCTPRNLEVSIVGDSIICPSENTTLRARSSMLYRWANTANPNTIFSTDSIITVSPSVTTTYLVYTIHDTAYFTVHVKTIAECSTPQITITGDSIICLGNADTLIVSGDANYRWANALSPNTIIDNDSVLIITPLINTTYICYSTNDTAYFNVYPITTGPCAKPQITITGDSIICLGNADTLTVSGDANYRWANALSPNTIIDFDSVLIITPLINTTYICYSTNDTAYFNVYPINTGICFKPQVNIQGDSVICFGDSTILTASQDTNYNWYIMGANTSFSQNNSVIVKPLNTTTYIVKANQSSDTITVNVEFESPCIMQEVFVPNVFTPNGDGINDVFKFEYNYTLTNFELYIFNRWGNKVYETTDAKFNWNGKYNNDLCSEGVYYFIANYKDYLGKNKEKKGTITLLH